jgi:hypothetical protein
VKHDLASELEARIEQTRRSIDRGLRELHWRLSPSHQATRAAEWVSAHTAVTLAATLGLVGGVVWMRKRQRRAEPKRPVSIPRTRALSTFATAARVAPPLIKMAVGMLASWRRSRGYRQP